MPQDCKRADNCAEVVRNHAQEGDQKWSRVIIIMFGLLGRTDNAGHTAPMDESDPCCRDPFKGFKRVSNRKIWAANHKLDGDRRWVWAEHVKVRRPMAAKGNTVVEKGCAIIQKRATKSKRGRSMLHWGTLELKMAANHDIGGPNYKIEGSQKWIRTLHAETGSIPNQGRHMIKQASFKWLLLFEFGCL